MIKTKGKVWVKVTDKNGKVKLDKCLGHNLITNAGKAAIAGIVSGIGGVSAFTYLAVGTSSTPVTTADTTLGSEISTSGLSRHAATVTLVTTSATNDTIQFLYLFSVTGTQTIQEIGIFNASSSGTMLGHKLTGAISVINTDQVQFTYQVQST